MATLTRHAALFRGAEEGHEHTGLEAIITLSVGLLYGTATRPWVR